MATTTKIPRKPEVDRTGLELDPRWQLAERVARSSSLSRATQLKAILLFISSQAIASPDEHIGDSQIAQQALGRGGNFNPVEDNIVRVQMARLRKRLDHYFSTEGANEETVITIPIGSYRPVFAPRAVQDCPAPVRPAHRSWLIPVGTLAGALTVSLAVACLVLWQENTSLRRQMSPVSESPDVVQFWAGVMSGNRNTDLVLADASFGLLETVRGKPYSLDDYLSGAYMSENDDSKLSAGTKTAITLLSRRRLISIGGLTMIQHFAARAPFWGKIHSYFARSFRPALINQDNVVLFGTRLSNPWIELFENQLDFAVQHNFQSAGVAGVPHTIILNRTPRAGEQSVYTPSGSVGYCTISYQPKSSRGGNVLIIGGTTSEAAQACGDFLLSEPDLLDLKRRFKTQDFPPFDLLMKTSQVAGTPITASIEAWRIHPYSR